MASLVEEISALVEEVSSLRSKLEAARTCMDQADCPLCQSNDVCALHKQIAKLAKVALKARVDELEKISDEQALALKTERVRANVAERAAFESTASYNALRDELPSIIATAKLQAVEQFTESQLRDQRHIEFIHKLARRLGVHPDSNLERVQSMLDDAIRKLLS